MSDNIEFLPFEIVLFILSNTFKGEWIINIKYINNSIYNKFQMINFRYNDFGVYGGVNRKVRYKEIDNIPILIFGSNG